jgi:hypothetical protein
MRYTTGEHIGYADRGAYIRANDESTFNAIKERKIPWHELLTSVHIYSAPLREASEVTHHVSTLLITRSEVCANNGLDLVGYRRRKRQRGSINPVRQHCQYSELCP